jgi:glutathione S-transferase
VTRAVEGRPHGGAAEVTLVSIGVSHYVEKVRWALDRARIPFREDAHVPLAHRRATRRAGGGDTAPVLVTPDGVFADSTDAVVWIDGRMPPERRLIPPERADEVLDLEALCDDELGPATRLWSYGHLLGRPLLGLRYGAPMAPVAERVGIALFYPAVVHLSRRHYRITRASRRDAEGRIDRLLGQIGLLLTDGRRYLAGDRFTLADLTFSALAAPALLPGEYGVPLPRVEEVPAAMARRVRAWRETPAGRHVLRMYREERR